MALKPSLRDVLTRLHPQGAVTPDITARAMTAMMSHWRTSTAMPWYVRALIGFGAWVAACFVFLFVFLLAWRGTQVNALWVGLGLCIGATLLRRVGDHLFLSQFALASSLTGQGLFLFGLAEANSSEAGTASGMLLLELSLLFAYPDRIQRFLATVGAAVALLALVAQARAPVLVDLMLLVNAALLHLLFLQQARLQRTRWEAFFSSVTFALAVTLFGALLAHSFEDLARELRLDKSASSLPVLTLGLALVTMYTASRVLQETGLEVSGTAGATVFAAIGLTALLTLNTPGVIAAAGVLALAFHRRSVLLLGLAVAFLLTFGVLYYYDLDLSLLAKSGALLGSGLVLLGLRLFILRRFPAPSEVP